MLSNEVVLSSALKIVIIHPKEGYFTQCYFVVLCFVLFSFDFLQWAFSGEGKKIISERLNVPSIAFTVPLFVCFFPTHISLHVSWCGLLSPLSLLNSSMTLVALPGLGRTANISSLWYFSLWSELIPAFIYQQGVTPFKAMLCFIVFLWTWACAFHSQVASDTCNKLMSLGFCFLLGQWWISKTFFYWVSGCSG